MSKSALNELCLRSRWPSPVYSTTKTGPGHIPTFHATVTVNGATFASELAGKSSKEAQNEAARVALLQLAAVAAQAPPPPSAGIQHIYKSNLQMYAQRRNLLLPMYAPERDGPPHASRFRCSVTIGGQTYRSEEFFSTLKDAENSAAKVALAVLQPSESGEEDSMYKSLLQERTQKEGGVLPYYETTVLGQAHAPTFVSTVQVKGQVFSGQEAKSKKLAEISAAKVAYTLLTEGGTLSQSTVQEPFLPSPNVDSVRLAHHQFVPPQRSMPCVQMGYMGNSSGSKKQQPCFPPLELKSTVLDHLYQHRQPKLPGEKGDGPSMVNPGFDSSATTFELSASPMAIQTSSIRNENTMETIPSSTTGMESSVTHPGSEIDTVIVRPHASPLVGPVESPIRVPEQTLIPPSQSCTPSATHATVPSDGSISCQNGGTVEIAKTGTEPSVIRPSSKIDSVIVNPPTSLPVVPAASPTTFPVQSVPVGSMSTDTPMNEGTSASLQHLIQTSTRQPNRIVVHPRNVSITYPNGSNVLPFSDDNWVAVKSSSQ